MDAKNRGENSLLRAGASIAAADCERTHPGGTSGAAGTCADGGFGEVMVEGVERR